MNKKISEKSAIDAIECILSSCDLFTKEKVIKKLIQMQPSYRSEYQIKRDIPSVLEMYKSEIKRLKIEVVKI